MNWDLAWIPGALIFMIPIVAIIVGYLTQKLKSEERLRAIEKGLLLPPDSPEVQVKDAWERAADLRVGGLVCMAVGVGLLALFWGLTLTLPEFPGGVMGAAAIPFLIGVALYHESNVRMRELGPRPTAPVSAPQSPRVAE